MVRQGTAQLLQQEADLEVIAEAGNGVQAIEMAGKLRPDLVIMDVRMPELSGVEATRVIRETLPEVRVLVLSAHENDQYLFSLLQAGANGYLLKTAPIQELIKAIHQVMEGLSPIDPSIAHKLVARISGRREDMSDEYPAEALTTREKEVLQMLAQGMNNRAIAEKLVISDRTVQAHLTSIFSKMNVNSRLEAVLLAIRIGWLTIER